MDAIEHIVQQGIPRPWRAAAGSISVNREEMFRYLGYRGQDIDPELAERMERVASDLGNRTSPVGVWSMFPVDAGGVDDAGEPCIRLAGSSLTLRGRDIFRHLKDARYAVTLACTLGMRSERELRRLSARQPLEGAVLDAACSALIEQAVDALEGEARRVLARAGLSCNWRYSPGYGDLPLDIQPAVLAALNATRYCGITITQTNLLVPSKSVTAFLGVFEGDTVPDDRKPLCATCRVRSGCAFRERGETCAPPAQAAHDASNSCRKAAGSEGDRAL